MKVRFINTMLNQQDITGEDYKSLTKMMHLISERMDKLALTFDENSEMVFANHILTLGKRILNKDFIVIDDALMVDVSNKAWCYANMLIDGIFETHGSEKQKAEIFLIATHIQVYLDKTEGGNKNE